MTDDPPTVEQVREVLAYENPYVRVYDDEVLRHGTPSRQLRIVPAGGHPGVAMLALCGDQVALVRTYRYATGSWEWSLPRGFAQGPDAGRTARAELREELGAEPESLELLGVVHPDSGLLDLAVHVFLARYATRVSAPQDVEEVAEVAWVDVAEILRRVAAGEVHDGFTLSALTFARAAGRLDF